MGVTEEVRKSTVPIQFTGMGGSGINFDGWQIEAHSGSGLFGTILIADRKAERIACRIKHKKPACGAGGIDLNQA